MRKIMLSFFVGIYSVLGAVTWTTPPDDLSPGAVDVPFSPFPVVVDSAGNATVAWMQLGGANNVIATVSKPFGSSWTPFPPTELTLPAVNAFQPGLAVDSAGNVTAIWGRGNFIQTAYKPFNTGTWSAITNLNTGTMSSFDADIAVDPKGDAVAVWAEASGGSVRIFSQSRIGGTWGATLPVSTIGNDADSPRIGVDSVGNAVVIWVETVLGVDYIRAATLSAGGALWMNFATLSVAGVFPQIPELVVDPMGNAVAVWEAFDTIFMVEVAQGAYFDGVSWSSATTLSTTTDDAFAPRVAVDPSGTAIAIWNGAFNGVQARTKPPGPTWLPIETISTGGGNNPDVGIDADGTAVAVWSEFSGGFNRIFTSAKLATGPWSASQIISDPVMAGDALGPSVAVDPTGDAVAVWRKLVGANFIAQAAAADISAVTGPGSIRGKKLLNQFALQSEYFNRLQWTPSTTTDLTGYKVYRNGVFIAHLPAGQTVYEDHLRLKKETDTYGVTSIDSNGSESAPITITIK